MPESSSHSPLSAVDKLIQMATGQTVPPPPAEEERPASEAASPPAEAPAEAAPAEAAAPVEAAPIEEAPVEEAAVEAAPVEEPAVEEPVAEAPVEGMAASAEPAVEETVAEEPVEEAPHRRGFFSFLGHRIETPEFVPEPPAEPVEEAVAAEPVAEESAPAVEEAPAEETASEAPAEEVPVEAASESPAEEAAPAAEPEAANEPFPVPAMEPVEEAVAAEPETAEEPAAEDLTEEVPAEEAASEAPAEEAAAEAEPEAAEEGESEPVEAVEAAEPEEEAAATEPETEETAPAAEETAVEEAAAEDSTSEESTSEEAAAEESPAEEPAVEEPPEEEVAAAAAEGGEAQYSLDQLLQQSSKRKTRLYGPGADVFPSEGGTTIMKQGAGLTDEMTEEQLKEMSKDPMWKTLVQHQGWLPVVTSLLPMLDVVTGRNQPGGMPDDMKDTMDGLLISNREVRSTLQGQAVELRRVEEGFGDLRETVDKTAFEQSAMADDLRGVQRLMKNAFLYVGILLGLLVVGIGYMAFLVFTYLNHPAH